MQESQARPQSAECSVLGKIAVITTEQTRRRDVPFFFGVLLHRRLFVLMRNAFTERAKFRRSGIWTFLSMVSTTVQLQRRKVQHFPLKEMVKYEHVSPQRYQVKSGR